MAVSHNHASLRLFLSPFSSKNKGDKRSPSEEVTLNCNLNDEIRHLKGSGLIQSLHPISQILRQKPGEDPVGDWACRM